jgi:dihydrofolate reductase
MTAAEALLLGRVTYDEFAPFWSAQTVADDPGAAFMNDTPKYVVSNTLSSADWANSVIIDGDLVAELSALKRTLARDLMIMGSGQLVRTLLAENLLDRLTLIVHPIILGKGKRLFEHGGPSTPLSLVSSQTLSSGVTVATYEPAAERQSQ